MDLFEMCWLHKTPRTLLVDMEGEGGEVSKMSLPRYMAKIPLAFGLLTTWDITEIGMADLILVRWGLALWFEWRILLKPTERT